MKQHPDPPPIPDHEVLRVIGRGSYGEIWLARSLTGALRAVKVVYRDTFETERAFNREFAGMSNFEPISRADDGFVDILHVGRAEAFFYYIMELGDDRVSGQRIDIEHYVPKTLKTEMETRGRLPVAECVQLGISLSDALGALHEHKLAHRDIKPAIIFVHGTPKLADIGLVASSGQRSFVGTEGYVPPEGPGTPESDIYSLGKVLYEISMGKDRLDFPEVTTSLDELPDKAGLMQLNEILLKACAHNPERRYNTARQMHDDLKLLEAGKGRKRGVAWAAIFAAGLFVIAAGWMLFHLLSKEQPPGLATAVVNTDPAGAMVLLGDRMKRSPAEFSDLEPGTYPLRVMLPGFDPVETKIDVRYGKTTPFFTLRRAKGSLRLTTLPSGAEFELRSGAKIERKGVTPATLADVPAGDYEVIARRDGRELTETVGIARNETAVKEMVFASGTVVVTSDPPAAAILVDGTQRGAAPLRIELPTGLHRVAARFQEWPEELRDVTVERDRDAALDFEFSNGSVKITSAPGGAIVLQAGKEIGQTPLLVEEVRPGEVTYELRLNGYKSAILTGTVASKQQVFLAARLEQKRSPEPGKPWENSIGMKFMPVGDAHFCVWKTRVKDYDAFCAATGRQHDKPDFEQGPEHPVVNVSFYDAQDFCKWLTGKERSENMLEEGQFYRLPSDLEWSLAVGLPKEGGNTPEERDGKIKGVFPWGKAWPPPNGAGNYADASARRQHMATIDGYNDGFPQTSPVGSFAANSFGLYDVGGNVWEWVQEGYNGGGTFRDWGVLRGGSWANSSRAELQSSYRNVVDRKDRDVIYGFRCVLVSEPAGEQ